MDINIRKEESKDYRIVEELTREAFWNLYVRGCDEHYLVHKMRNHSDFIPELDYVAEADNKIVGNIMFTRSWVESDDGKKIETLTFGPVCVLPQYQGRGVGSVLLGKTIEMAKNMGTKAIIILGHPKNYVKYGFKNCIDFSVSDIQGKYPFGQLVLELEDAVFKGNKWKFFPSPVYEIDQKEVEEFDRQFPQKSKEFKPSQEEFSIAIRAYLS